MGGNKPISEYMSLILEPVARTQEGMEINASSGLLEVVESLNDDLAKHRNEGEELTSFYFQELMREESERISNLEE